LSDQKELAEIFKKKKKKKKKTTTRLRQKGGGGETQKKNAIGSGVVLSERRDTQWRLTEGFAVAFGDSLTSAVAVRDRKGNRDAPWQGGGGGKNVEGIEKMSR